MKEEDEQAETKRKEGNNKKTSKPSRPVKFLPPLSLQVLYRPGRFWHFLQKTNNIISKMVVLHFFKKKLLESNLVLVRFPQEESGSQIQGISVWILIRLLLDFNKKGPDPASREFLFDSNWVLIGFHRKRADPRSRGFLFGF